MRFRQLDRIAELVVGERIKAFRKLHANEDFLRDHFPLFPVMPGVLMLEALFQASCWLIRASENFDHSILLLKEAKNVKFADFIEPGHVLEINVEFVKSDSDTVIVKASGNRGDVVAVSARLVIGKSNLVSKTPELGNMDIYVKEQLKAELLRLQQA